MLDEQHYVPEANFIIAGETPDNPEHPPLGKLIIVAGIKSFGDNALGWRFFSVLFGVASIILFYLICQKLTSLKWLPLLATFLFAFENMCFVMSCVAMLDVFCITLMLASFLLYLHHKYIPAAIMVALSALAKLSGVFGGGIILLHWLLIRRQPKLDGAKFLIAAPLAFLLFMPLFDYLAMGEWLYPWDRIDFMISTHSTLTFASVDHDALSYPWEWIISLKPMWFWYDPTYQANPNWTLWVLIIPAMCYALYGTIKHYSLCTFAAAWFVGTYLIWIPIVLITDRIMFRFYLYPTIGVVCLILGLAIHQILTASSRIENRKIRWAIRTPIMAFLIGHLAVFVMMSPYCGWPPASY